MARLALILAGALACAGCATGGGKKDTEDETEIDAPADTTDTPADTPADTAPDTAPDPEHDAPGDATEDAEEEMGPGECGDGTLNTGEACDDGNTRTEACDTTDPGACLSDCSLLMGDCGNGAPNPGEACDDGDDDSMDDCTTSCTTNDHHIGAPCTCTGTECEGIDFTAGTIAGCESVASLADSTRSLACVRSVELVPGTNIYMAEGFCTLMALSCTGDTTVCPAIPVTGDVDAITCPTGYEIYTLTRTLGTATITLKACLDPCTSDADCRWNAVEGSSSPLAGQCGQYACLPRSDSGANTCVDIRNGT